MANASLAAKYRPQTFCDVVGQDTIKAILSRASEQDKIAPAYLLCGTRGVGKTTLARVFAKALNCEHAPTKEPCNNCNNCRQVTQGSFVDVVEIDGASNRGIDDVRKLRETIGYSPLNGRYKVIIIDEAHMLTKEAFNALLKTLEEPPKNVVFILATTEQHKFPITILSRCQQFVFTQVSELELEKQLQKVLTSENIKFAEEALKLIARRASGSVRDSMSLLGQCLAFMLDDSDDLSEEKVREVLGLVGLEYMDKLITSLYNQDIAKLTFLTQDLLSHGVDLGFFLKEFATLWRNLFVLKQSGKEASFAIPLRELVRLESHATKFTLTYIHAAWQMTLDNQRRILQSLEPASALELLLLNLALLPKILPIQDLNMAKLEQEANTTQGNKIPLDGEDGGGEFVTPFKSELKGEFAGNLLPTFDKNTTKNNPLEDLKFEMEKSKLFVPEQKNEDFFTPNFKMAEETKNIITSSLENSLTALREEIEKTNNFNDVQDDNQIEAIDEKSGGLSYEEFESQYQDLENYKDGYSSFSETAHAEVFPNGEANLFLEHQDELQDELHNDEYTALDWDSFLEFAEEKKFPEEYLPYLKLCNAKCNENSCIINITSETALQQVRVVQKEIKKLLLEFTNKEVEIRYTAREIKRRSLSQMMDAMYDHPQIQILQSKFNASLLRCTDLKKY